MIIYSDKIISVPILTLVFIIPPPLITKESVLSTTTVSSCLLNQRLIKSVKAAGSFRFLLAVSPLGGKDRTVVYRSCKLEGSSQISGCLRITLGAYSEYT